MSRPSRGNFQVSERLIIGKEANAFMQYVDDPLDGPKLEVYVGGVERLSIGVESVNYATMLAIDEFVNSSSSLTGNLEVTNSLPAPNSTTYENIFEVINSPVDATVHQVGIKIDPSVGFTPNIDFEVPGNAKISELWCSNLLVENGGSAYEITDASNFQFADTTTYPAGFLINSDSETSSSRLYIPLDNDADPFIFNSTIDSQFSTLSFKKTIHARENVFCKFMVGQEIPSAASDQPIGVIASPNGTAELCSWFDESTSAPTTTQERERMLDFVRDIPISRFVSPTFDDTSVGSTFGITPTDFVAESTANGTEIGTQLYVTAGTNSYVSNTALIPTLLMALKEVINRLDQAQIDIADLIGEQTPQ